MARPSSCGSVAGCSASTDSRCRAYVWVLDAFIVRLIEDPKNVSGVNCWNVEGLGRMAEHDTSNAFLGRAAQP